MLSQSVFPLKGAVPNTQAAARHRYNSSVDCLASPEVMVAGAPEKGATRGSSFLAASRFGRPGTLTLAVKSVDFPPLSGVGPPEHVSTTVMVIGRCLTPTQSHYSQSTPAVFGVSNGVFVCFFGLPCLLARLLVCFCFVSFRVVPFFLSGLWSLFVSLQLSSCPPKTGNPASYPSKVNGRSPHNLGAITHVQG